MVYGVKIRCEFNLSNIKYEYIYLYICMGLCVKSERLCVLSSFSIKKELKEKRKREKCESNLAFFLFILFLLIHFFNFFVH